MGSASSHPSNPPQLVARSVPGTKHSGKHSKKARPAMTVFRPDYEHAMNPLDKKSKSKSSVNHSKRGSSSKSASHSKPADKPSKGISSSKSKGHSKAADKPRETGSSSKPAGHSKSCKKLTTLRRFLTSWSSPSCWPYHFRYGRCYSSKKSSGHLSGGLDGLQSRCARQKYASMISHLLRW